MLYTFITEKAGSTLIEQFRGRDLVDAVRVWNTRSEAGPKFEPDRLAGADGPAPIVQLEQAWCFSGVDQNEIFYLVHIVATAKAGTDNDTDNE